MKLFLDSANIDEIKEMLPFIDGVTTNPSLLKSFDDAKKIVSILRDKPVSVEVTESNYSAMVIQGRDIAKMGTNAVVKLPCTQDGIHACKILTSENIKTNVTLVFSVSQAYLAMRAGATYISPFIGRLRDFDKDKYPQWYQTVGDIKKYTQGGSQTLGASIRTIEDIESCLALNLDVITVPYKLLKDMFNHELTDKGLKKFMEDWSNK